MGEGEAVETRNTTRTSETILCGTGFCVDNDPAEMKSANESSEKFFF